MRSRVVRWLQEMSRDEEFLGYLTSGLVKLCAIDNTPKGSTVEMSTNESEAFDVIMDLLASSALRNGPSNGHAPFVFLRHPLDGSIRDSEMYTPPYYSTEESPYAGRANLLALWNPPDESKRPGVALNAHIDTVAPHIPPSSRGTRVVGRGTADDKGGCITIVGALKLIHEIERRFGNAPRSPVTAMFVIDEETGGNGSLSLAADRDLRTRYETIVVVETADCQVYPANRGALWYRVEIPGVGAGDAESGEAALAFDIVRRLEAAGAAIREESIHPLFPDRPVQTCHGVLGSYGEHPSRVCGHLRMRIRTDVDPDGIRAAVEHGLETYLARYGDKTRAIDDDTGRPKLDHHYDLEVTGGTRQSRDYAMDVWGCSGHMGAVRELDGAITKAAFLAEALEKADPAIAIAIDSPPGPLVLEGGQGFLPTHSLGSIRERMEAAVHDAWLRRARTGYAGMEPFFSCEKLHNDAFERPSDSAAVVALADAAEHIGICIRRPLRGFPVSCDARIFAHLYPDLEVVTTGPGKLADAHSDSESVDVRDIAAMSASLALFILQHGGDRVK